MKKLKKLKNNQPITHYWTAYNGANGLDGVRMAKSLQSAVRAAHNYVDDELDGKGYVKIYDHRPSIGSMSVRRDEKTMATEFKWKITEKLT